MEGKTQQTSAAMAGMSVRSTHKWQRGPLPSETGQERWWRTRTDPFDGVWEEEIEPLLQGEAAGRLRATTIIEWLEERYPGRFSASQLRTMQRRLQDWRALNGPDQEVYFPQEHLPGREARVDYRHIIGSLVRKPGAFARYRFREQMFPTMTFRLSYDALKRWRGEWADVEYVRILHLSATTMESTVDSALALLLEAGEPFDYASVRELANPAPPRAPVLSLPGMPDLRVYDSLLAGVT